MGEYRNFSQKEHYYNYSDKGFLEKYPKCGVFSRYLN